MDWEGRLSSEGFRITAPRLVVMAVLCGASEPLAPNEIWEQGRRVHCTLGLVTVYRTLALLEKFCWVRRVHREDGCHGYLLSSTGHSHAIICGDCGRAAEFSGTDDLGDLIAEVEASTGYRVDSHLLQLSGLCAECRARCTTGAPE